MIQKVCEKCGKPASVIYKESINGKARELCLCADCAAKMGVGAKTAALPGFFDDDFFGALPLFSDLFAPQASAREERCPACGKTVRQIQKDGKFGCSQCYETFGKGLDLKPFVGRGYRGEPLTAPAQKEEKPEDRLKALKAELKRVLAAEEYEKAAGLRDQIRALEGK